MQFERKLYVKQEHPSNYMNIEKYKQPAPDKTIIYDIFRLTHSLTSIVIFFNLFLIIEKYKCSFILFSIFILIFIILSYFYLRNFRKYFRFIKTCSIILVWVYLVSPIIKTLTAEISTDTIYLHYFLTSLINVFDTIRCSILNESFDLENKRIEALEKELENKSLSLEEAMSLRPRKYNLSILGYNMSIMGSIFLSSRLSDDKDVNFLLILCFVMFILFPLSRERFKCHVNFKFTFLYLSLGLLISCFFCRILFWMFTAFCIFLYLTCFFVLRMLNYKKTN